MDDNTPTTSLKAQLHTSLFNASLSAQWDIIPDLCDQYTSARLASGELSNLNTNNEQALFTDEYLSKIDQFDEENRRNPLLAAVLHVAVDLAAASKAVSLFGDAPTQEMVDNEERKRLQGTRLLSYDNPLTADDFCPYLQMKEMNNVERGAVTDDERRARRKAITKLCRANPLWILLPMNPRTTTEDEDALEGDPPRGTNALHVAVRSRNATLTNLLIKYCKRATEICDGDGCTPLHYAVRPPDELAVYRKAILSQRRSLQTIGVDGLGPMDAGAGGISSGSTLTYYGKIVFKSIHEMSGLGMYRVRRLRRKMNLMQLNIFASHIATNARKRKAASSTSGKGAKAAKSTASGTRATRSANATTTPVDASDETSRPPVSIRRSSRLKEKDEQEQAKARDMYESPSSLVRAMMYHGTVEEDSHDLVSSEWKLNVKMSDAESKALSSDYPLVMLEDRTISRGIHRANRPWKTEQHRIDTIRLLTSVYNGAMSIQNDDGGDTPMLLICHTLEGGVDDDDDDELVLDPDVAPAAPAQRPNVADNVRDETGEDGADYEADVENVADGGEDSKPAARRDGESAVEEGRLAVANNSNAEGNADQQNNNLEEANRNENVEAEGEEANNGELNDEDDIIPDDPLEAIWVMLAADKRNDEYALGMPNDEGETPLHAATRIGASARLVRRIVRALPSTASTPAEDGSTPLHLACRRASHLAPEGTGGLATYDADTIRLVAEAAGAGTLVAADDEGRTPFHVACYYGASPEVLAELSDVEGGREALLVRDVEGHAPLGVYCRHAADFYGMRVLVERCPEAAACLADGKRLPLHRVLSLFNLAVNVDVLNLLGTAYPRGVDTKDSHGMTPLALLCHSYQGPMNVDLPKLAGGQTTLGRCLSNKVWLMAKYLVLAGKANTKWNQKHTKVEDDEDGNPVIKQPKERLLHATLRDPASSVEIVKLAAVIHKEQLKEADEDGNYPLHLCCERESGFTENSLEYTTEEQSSDEDSVFERVNRDIQIDTTPISLETSEADGRRARAMRNYNRFSNFLPILYSVLKNDMSAARLRNQEGKFPLNLLIDRKASWTGGGVDRVFKAFPAAIFSYEISNAILGKMLVRVAAVTCNNPEHRKREEAANLGAFFELLRGKPTVLEGSILGKAAPTASSSTGRGGRRSKRLRTK
jgi:hypothetical protein